MTTAGARPKREGGRFNEIRHFATLSSTNDYLMGEARKGAAEGLVVVADHQAAGRGRLGRSWVAPPGSALLASVLLRPAGEASILHLLAVAVGLAAADACSTRAGVRPELKWPNDLMIGDRKLAGVLAESEPSGDGTHRVVIGLGLNVAWPPEGPPPEIAGRAVALSELGNRHCTGDEILEGFLAELDRRCGAFGTETGRERLASEYRSRCVTVGRRVRVDLVGESFVGLAVGLGEGGQLLVDVDGNLRLVTAGDVVHVRPAG